MTMKQTQTKLFDFSDVGLDFSAGSKNLFPDRFKKMLSLGYNEQTVSSVAVTGNQVVLTYGVSHGYVADRVLKITSGALAAINNGEFWIDSVTANTVTLTIDGAPISVAGGFVTKIASLGWQLVYEQSYVHLYKMKQLDESDIFIRLVFQSVAARRNRVGVCVGKTANTGTGEITDANTLTEYATATAPDETFAWEFSILASNSQNNWTYSQSFSAFGKSMVVGSLYHVSFQTHIGSNSIGYDKHAGVYPVDSIGYDQLHYPVVFGESYGNAAISGSTVAPGNNQNLCGYVGKHRVLAYQSTATNTYFYSQSSTNSATNYIPNEIDSFNTISAMPIPLYLHGNGSFIGYMKGLYMGFAATNMFNATSHTMQTLPMLVPDVDVDNLVLLSVIHQGNITSAIPLVIPVEEIKRES